MQILLTNDDGIHSPGLKTLAASLRQLGTVTVVAPASEQSGVSHALTFRTPLFVQELTWDNGMKVWAVEGTPADCTRIGVLNLCSKKPDVVVSGINNGLNVGCNVYYSGTVAGAEEGATLGIDSFAVSLEYDETPPWEEASTLITQVIRQILESHAHYGSPSLININVPLSACTPGQLPEVCVVPVDRSHLTEAYQVRKDPYGKSYYWLFGRVTPKDPAQNTDRNMVKKGFVTVTPLEYNRTNRAAIESLELAFIPDEETTAEKINAEKSDPAKPHRETPHCETKPNLNETSGKPIPGNQILGNQGTNESSSQYLEGT